MVGPSRGDPQVGGPRSICSTRTVEHIYYTRCKSSSQARRAATRGPRQPGQAVSDRRTAAHAKQEGGQRAASAWRGTPVPGGRGRSRGRAPVGVLLAGQPRCARRVRSGVRRNRPAGRVLPARRLAVVHRRAVPLGRHHHDRAPVAGTGAARRGRRCPGRGTDRILAGQARRAGAAGPRPQPVAAPRCGSYRPAAGPLRARPGDCAGPVHPRGAHRAQPACRDAGRARPHLHPLAGHRRGGGVTLAGYLLGASVPGIDQYLLPVIAIIVIASAVPVTVELVRAAASARPARRAAAPGRRHTAVPAYSKMSSGRNAETRTLGTSTTWLTLRSTATLHSA